MWLCGEINYRRITIKPLFILMKNVHELFSAVQKK